MKPTYRIFISSTFEDLKEQRRALFEATTAMGHIPIGMEGFNPSDRKQWKYISSRVAQCDYFALVVAHRSGSRHERHGTSYTEAEYDLALKLKIPVASFIIDKKASWPADRCDTGADARALIEFKRRLSKVWQVALWTDTPDLVKRYISALHEMFAETPRAGLYPAGISPELEALGISGIEMNSTSIPYRQLLLTAGVARIVMNDAHGFIRNNTDLLRQRVRKNLYTQVLLVHPDSALLPLIAEKSDKALDEQRRDILTTVDALKDIARPAPELVSCLGHHFINAHSSILSDDLGFTNLYLSRLRIKELPLLTLRAGPVLRAYNEDFERLWRGADADRKNDLLALARGRNARRPAG